MWSISCGDCGEACSDRAKRLGEAIEIGPGEGEINIGAGPMEAKGPRAMEDGLLDRRECGHRGLDLRHGGGGQTEAGDRELHGHG